MSDRLAPVPASRRERGEGLRPGSRGFIALLGALGALTPLSVDATLPALPVLAQVFDAGAERVQLTISVFVLAFAGGQVIYGPLSDRFGRRPVLLGGLVLYLAGAVGCALAETLAGLVAMRALQGLGASAGRAMIPAIVRDSVPREAGAAVLSFAGTVSAIGPLAAPVLGGYLLILFGWRAIFLMLAATALMVLAATWRGLGETNQRRDPGALRPSALFRSWATFLGDRRSLGCALVNAAVFAGIFCFISNASFVLIALYGVSTELFGWLFALAAASFMSGTALNGRLAARHGARVQLCRGLAAYCVAAVLFGLAGAFGGAGLLVAAATLLTFTGGLVFSNATAIAMEPMARIAGVAASLLGALQMAGASLAAFLVGMLYDGSAVPMAAGAVLCAGAAASAYLGLVKEKGRGIAPAAR